MRIIRSARWLMLALLLSILPTAKSHASVFVSVGFAPPVLPVYVQPPCPEPNLIWVPGYWAYGDDGYYWVPGAWVPAPYEGALWTPPYWGWNEGVYVFYPGYWGWHVGYYGGVNYGYGYMGVGYVGGWWDHDRFMYNTAVVRVNTVVVRNVYVDRTIVERNTIVNERRVAYAGGPGGIRHDPTPEERQAMHEQHLPPTQAQQQRIQTARSDRANYFNVNHGRPQQVAIARPLPAEHHAAPPAPRGFTPGARPNGPADRPAPQERPYNRPAPQERPYNQPAPERPNNRPSPQERQHNQPAPQERPYNRPAPPQPYNRPAPQERPYNQPAPERPNNRPSPQERPYSPPPEQRPQARPEPRPEQREQPRPESRPRPEPKEKPQHR